MPLELGVWRIDGGLTALPATGLDQEARLEDLLDRDITIANPGWMIIGRQVVTGFGSRVDLLAIDEVGDLVLLELKRDQTPREVVAQVLEYGAWVTKLRADDIAQIYRRYVEIYHPERGQESFDQAFCKRFAAREVPEDLNQAHELVVVASQFDLASERIVQYLADEHEVGINAIFFRVFRDGEREYLTRVWLRDSADVDVDSPVTIKGEWNEEFYVSYGGNRDWEEARNYGFVSGGGGHFYSKTLFMLKPGNRVWVNIPGTGYVGVGVVGEPAVSANKFLVRDSSGKTLPITSVPGLRIAKTSHVGTDPENDEYVVRVKWLKTVPEAEAIKERGFFGNQNTVAKPRADSWRHTVERLKVRLGVQD